MIETTQQPSTSTPRHPDRQLQIVQRRRRPTPRRRDPAAERLARVLGWFSIGLGLTEFAAPRTVARLIGLDERRNGGGDVARTLRMFGMREIAAGLGIFSKRQPVGWLWARVAGDVMDLSFLGGALRRASAEPARLAAAAVTVAGVTALDVVCSQRLSARRAITNETEADGHVRLTSSLAINRPRADCYAFWRRLENLPRVMHGLESVTEMDDGRSHWKATTPSGLRLEWDAEITQDQENELISWRSVEDADLTTDGSVHFLPGPNGKGTLLRVVVRYRPPGGALGAVVTQLFGRPAQQVLKQDLRRLKQILETGDIITTENQPHGPAAISLTRALSRS